MLNLKGEQTIRHEAGSVYNDPGASATDLADGDMSRSIEVESTLDIDQPGDYLITYNVVDGAGNKAKELIRNITVVDTTPPIITINGRMVVAHEAGDEYKDLGAVAYDVVDGDITEFIEDDGDVEAHEAE